jgi:predicted enzyme related to lactoylglutathione lyase
MDFPARWQKEVTVFSYLAGRDSGRAEAIRRARATVRIWCVAAPVDHVSIRRCPVDAGVLVLENGGPPAGERVLMPGEPTDIGLGVTDADAARTFYGALLGWQPSGSAGPGQVDTPTLSIGIHDRDPKAWFEVFFAVDDLDASLAQVVALGGRVEGEQHDDAGFGRRSECSDDQGVRFGLRQQR